jgi:hypothetical protein
MYQASKSGLTDHFAIFVQHLLFGFGLAPLLSVLSLQIGELQNGVQITDEVVDFFICAGLLQRPCIYLLYAKL